jgi:aspartate aminotransferase
MKRDQACPAYCSERTLGYGRQKSAIRELFEYGKTVAGELGPQAVFDFSIGNPSVPPPKEVNQAFSSLLENESPLALHGYTSAAGDPQVRRVIAEQLNQEFGTDYQAKDLYLTCGAAAALSATFRALTLEGEANEFIAIAPYFPEYKCYVEGHGGRLISVPSSLPHLSLPLGAIEKAITSSTRAVIINSPNNPSGKIYWEAELAALSALLDKKASERGRPLYLVSDEPYRELVYDGHKTPFIPLLYRNALVCYSYSKALSMPGERIGYVLVPPGADHAEDLYNAIAGSARSMGYVCAPSLIQRVIGLCAHVKPDMTVYDFNRKTLYEGLTQVGYQCIEPHGAFYLFVQAPGGDAQAFSSFAKEHYKLLVVPSESFGFPGFVRISYCVSSERIQSALPLFAECLAEYQKTL